MESLKTKKIGIFGGTFNPIHKGHIHIIQLAKEKQNLDEVWVIPTNKTPLKENIVLDDISPQQRFEMTSKTLKTLNFSWLKTKEYEINKKDYSYTIDTLKHYISTYKNNSFYLILGEDRYDDFSSWKNYEEILKLVQKVLIFSRSEKITTNSKGKFRFYENEKWDVSSKVVLQENEWKYLDDETIKYISKNHLYIKTIVFYAKYNASFNHSTEVAKQAKKLAEKYDPKNAETAWVAGMIHDLFKKMNWKDQLKYLSDTLDNMVTPPNEALHGYTASLWYKNEYKGTNKNIIESLKKHTTASKNMTTFDKIVYVADKIALDRGDDAKEIRELAFKDLDLAFMEILKKTVKKLKRQNITIEGHIKEAFEEYIQKENE